ncbi:sensor histidine kinase [Brevibacterium renqingii]|uniref:sensor histidine kinase n=1 Tax=Brevibacterium renqingii TaxID=2776916 RepID=UPI001AE0347A|nr:histidine kinase [Brevibacterium renqingii]
MRRFNRWLWLIPVPLAFGFELLLGSGWFLLLGNVVAVAVALPVLIRHQQGRVRAAGLWMSVCGLLVALGLVAIAHTISLTVLWLSLVTLAMLARSASGRVPTALIVILAVANALVPGLMPDGLIYALASAVLIVAAISIGLMLRFTDRSLLERQATAAEAERRRIATELHDLIAHEVTGIVVLAQAAARSDNADLTSTALHKIEESGTRALEEIRRLVADGDADRPARAPVAESAQALRDRVEDYGEQAEISIETTTDVDRRIWPVLDRVLVETLTNVRRHAGPDAPVRVTVATPAEAAGAVVMVVRNGPGTGGLGAGSGTGLSSLRTRVSHLGGTIEAGRDAGGGWSVRTELPSARDEGKGTQ